LRNDAQLLRNGFSALSVFVCLWRSFSAVSSPARREAMMWVNEPNKSTRSRQISKKKTKSSGQRQVQEETMPPSPEPDGLDSLAISLCEQLRTRRT